MSKKKMQSNSRQRKDPKWFGLVKRHSQQLVATRRGFQPYLVWAIGVFEKRGEEKLAKNLRKFFGVRPRQKRSSL